MKDAKIAEMSQSLASLDLYRDKLVSEANSKDELLANMRRNVEEKKAGLDRQKLRAAQLEKEVGLMKEMVREKDSEIAKHEARLTDTRRQLQDSREQALSLSTQIRELRDDLETMTQVRTFTHHAIIDHVVVGGCLHFFNFFNFSNFFFFFFGDKSA